MSFDNLYRAKQYQNQNQRPTYQSPNNTPVVQKQAGSSPMDDFAQAYAQSQDPTNPFQMGKNMRSIYDNAMARRNDGWYGNSYHNPSDKMSDKAYFSQNPDKIGTGEFGSTADRIATFNGEPIDPKTIQFNNQQAVTSFGKTMPSQATNMLAQGNNAVNGGVGSLNLASNSVNGGALTSGVASGSQAIGASTAGLGANTALTGVTDSAIAANTAGITSGAASGGAIGAATEGATAAGSAATPALAAAAPYAVGALGVYGLGRWLDWW